MRTWILAGVAAALPLALYLPLVDAAAPGAGILPDPRGRWIALGLVSAASLLWFLGVRRQWLSDGTALASALALSCFPTIPDLVASPATLGLAAIAGAAALAALASLFRPAPRPEKRTLLLPALLSGLAVLFALRPAPLPIPSDGLHPFGVLPLLAGVLFCYAADVLVRRDDLSAVARRAFVAGIAAALALSALLGQVRVRSWQDPAAFWERAVAAAPDNPAALGTSAWFRSEAGDFAGAEARLRAFVAAVDARGKELGFDAEVRRAGAEGAVRAAARLLRERKGDPAMLTEVLKSAEALGPRISAVRRALGEARLALGDLVEARRHLLQAVRDDRTDAAAWDALARTHLALGDPGAALAAGAQAAGLSPRDARFVGTYATALLATNRDGEALQILHDALGDPPFDPAMARAFADAHLAVARKEVSGGLKGRALRRADTGLEADPGHAGCAELRDRLRAEFEAERPEAEGLIRTDPGGSVPLDRWRKYAAWLCQWGDYGGAEPHYASLLQRYGSLAEVQYDYAFYFWERRGTLEGYEKAVDAYRDALTRDDKFVEARNRLWRCLLVLGRTEAAAAEARKFLDLAPSHPDAFDAERFLEGK